MIIYRTIVLLWKTRVIKSQNELKREDGDSLIITVKKNTM